MVLALGPGMSSLVTMELLKSREGSGAGSADQMFLVLLDMYFILEAINYFYSWTGVKVNDWLMIMLQACTNENM